jgi:hypothetical protein
VDVVPDPSTSTGASVLINDPPWPVVTGTVPDPVPVPAPTGLVVVGTGVPVVVEPGVVVNPGDVAVPPSLPVLPVLPVPRGVDVVLGVLAAELVVPVGPWAAADDPPAQFPRP